MFTYQPSETEYQAALEACVLDLANRAGVNLECEPYATIARAAAIREVIATAPEREAKKAEEERRQLLEWHANDMRRRRDEEAQARQRHFELTGRHLR